MPLAGVERTNFAAGQLDSVAQKDRSKALYSAGCRAAKNLRILNGGGVKRRPGTWRRLELTNGKTVGIEYTLSDTDSTVYKVLFSDTQVDIVDDTETIVSTITGQPWTASILDELYFDLFEGNLTVCHTSFWPRIVSLSSGTWSVANFAFDTAFSGGPAQPYYRYAAKNITLTPGGLTGSISLVTSAAVFQSGHVGTYFRYLGYAILITAVTDSTHATGTVQTTLPSTVTVTVSDASGFAVDESVAGVDSNANGVVTNIAGSVLTVAYTSGLTGFNSNETLVGGSSNSQATITAGPSGASPAAVVDWDEQAFSSVRGYPGGCATHRGRLYFFNLRDLPRGVTASESGNPANFLIGANDGDAFFELVPDYEGQRVLHVLTAEQGLVVTTKSVYYLPEYGTQVVTPSTIDFKDVARIGAATPRPIKTERGYAFIENGSNRVMAIIATGNFYHPWDVTDISAFWRDLITGPRGMAATIAITAFPERYGFVINDDGTVACVKAQDYSQDVPVGWTPWQTNGAFRSMFSAGGKLFAVVQRLINSTEVWTLEEFDEALYLDNCIFFTGASSVLTPYASTTVSVMSGTAYKGDYALDSSGDWVSFDLADGSYVAGMDLIMELQPTTPVPDHPAYRFGKRISIPRCFIHVIDTGGYTVGTSADKPGQLSPAYRVGENTDNAPPLRTEARRFTIPGRDAYLSPYVTQFAPAPFQVLAMSMEVSF